MDEKIFSKSCQPELKYQKLALTVTIVLSQRDRQILALIGVGKRLSLKAICFRDFEAYMNHILLVILAYNLLKSLYPKSSIGEAKKQVSQSSQAVFLYELKDDFTNFHGNRIVKSKIYQALSALTGLFPLRLAD